MHKINSSIDQYYKKSLKKENFYLFLICQNWEKIISPEISSISKPHKISIIDDKIILQIKVHPKSLIVKLQYYKQTILNNIHIQLHVKIEKIKFI